MFCLMKQECLIIMSINKICNLMQISQKPLDFIIKSTDMDIEINIKSTCQSFLNYFTYQRIMQLVPSEIVQKYKIEIKGLSWKFQNLLVFSDIDHQPLIQSLKTELNSLVFLFIAYPDEHYGKVISKQIKQIQKIFCCPPSFRENKQKIVVMLVKKNKKETIISHLSRLKEFVSQKLFYLMDQHLAKTKLHPQEYNSFLQGLIYHYKEILKKFLTNKMKKIGLEDQLVIKCIRNVSQREEDEVKIPKSKMGIIIEVSGFQEFFGKLFHIFQRWLYKLNWMIAQVQRIECCSAQNLVQWFKENHQHLIYPLSLKQRNHRIVIFSPKKQRLNFEKILRITTRMVTGKQQEQNFSSIFQFKNEFKKYIASQKIGETNLRVYQHFILFEGDPNIEQKIRKKVKYFIQNYKQQKVEIEEFKSDFHISLLRNFYSQNIKCSPVRLIIQNGKLFRCNPKKISESVVNQIKEIYQLITKEIVTKPLSKLLPRKKDYFRVSQAPAYYRTTQWLQTKMFKIKDKINIYLKSYGTLNKGSSSCIFFVSDPQKCFQLRQILQLQGGISNSFFTNLKKNMILTMPLRYCKYFNKINVCCFQIKKGRYGGENRSSQSKIIQFIQGLVDEEENMRQLKMMFPSDFQDIEYILSKFLPNMLLSVKYNAGFKKDLVLYTSVCEGNKTRKAIIDFLKHFRFQGENKVQKITDLNLKISQMQTIIEYKYYQLKYFDNDVTKSTTPMNSYIFSKEFRKQIKTPIFLQSREQMKKLKYNEYLMSYVNWQVYEIKEDEIIKLKNKCQNYEELFKLCSLIKKYFQYLDFLVVYGDVQRDIFSQKFAYTDCSEKLYKRFQKVKIEKKQQKILVLNNMQPIQYQLITNNHLKLYTVQTHPQKIQQLLQLKKCVSLV